MPINWLQPKRTPAQVLAADLNKGGVTSWVEVPGYHTLIEAEFKNNNEDINFNLQSGAIVKSFINTDTGELRTYVINHLDVPERPTDQ